MSRFSAIPITVFFLCAPPAMGASPSDSPYLVELLRRAKAARLSEQEAWLRLGHWRRTLFGHQSEIDGLRFFLSPKGKGNPAAELEATLRGFLAPLKKPPPGPPARQPVASRPSRVASASKHPGRVTGASRPSSMPAATSRPAASRAKTSTPDTPQAQAEAKVPPPSPHALCRFPARFSWLHSKLGFDLRRLPKPRCRGLMRLWRRVQPRSATLVFSSYYLNNPASAFGHTFLRLGKVNPYAVGERRDLLDFGVSFSADVDTPNALLYAIKGLSGLFRGTFKLVPYYYKVREYNDYESRDIWEYELNLSPRAIQMLVAHLWEMNGTHFDYFYLGENCSYHILGLLEAADPKLKLLSRLQWPVLPANTVHVVASTPGLVRGVRYRPSLRSTFKHRVKHLSQAQRRAVAQLATDPRAPLPRSWSKTQRVPVLDAAADLVDIRHARELVHKREGKGAELKQQLLKRRARLLVPSPDSKIAPPVNERPETGHGARRIGFGVGWAERGAVYQSFDIRWALHDLADPLQGQPELAQIEFFALRMRQRYGSGSPLLQNFSLFRVVSLSPLSRFSLGPSWKLDVGATSLDDGDCKDCVASKVAFATGGALSYFDGALTLFALLDLRLYYAPGLEGIEGSGLRAGFGVDGGMRLTTGSRLTLLLTGRFTWLPEQRPVREWNSVMTLRWGLTRHLAASLEGAIRDGRPEAQLLLLSYF